MSAPAEIVDVGDGPTPPSKWKAADVLAALRKLYALPEYAILENVHSGAGSHRHRYTDALMMSLFPSRGLTIHGFEIKVSRGDWLRELRAPAKADAMFRFCDYWWLAVSDLKIVKDAELPDPWGLVAPNESGWMHVVKAAPKLDPEPIGRPLLAAIVRRSQEQSVDDRVIHETRAIAYRQGIEHGLDRGARDRERLEGDLASIRETVRAFEEASGVDLMRGWVKYGVNSQPQKIGEAVRLILNGEHVRAQIAARRIRDQLQHVLETLNAAVEEEIAG